MDRDILIGLFVVALVIIEVVNIVARNRGAATMWTAATETLKEQSRNVNQTDLIEKAMISVVPADLLRQQIIGGTQEVAAFIKRLAPDDLDSFIDEVTKYQQAVLDGKPNVPPMNLPLPMPPDNPGLA